jgi:hypothetical protein
MPIFPRRIYIQDFIGLSNRLESLALAFALRAAHGHEIRLDWPELDTFAVADTQRGGPGLMGRLGAARVRTCTSRLFQELKHQRSIILRAVHGPEAELLAVYPTLPGKLRLAAPLREAIHATFADIGAHPVVGVHVRRGDFVEADANVYDATARSHPAVPLWWYEHAMERIVARAPETRFLLCCTGDAVWLAHWRERFRIIEVTTANPYTYKGAGHASARHPVADLFALACCPVLLATPISSFSHWAANVLGGPAICLAPPLRTRRDAPELCRVDLRGRQLSHWVAAGRQGTGLLPVTAALDDVDLSGRASAGWIQPMETGR